MTAGQFEVNFSYLSTHSNPTRMLQHIREDRILFLDIETVPQHPVYEALPERFQELWAKKSKSIAREEETAEELYERAGIYAEFGKVICISVGFVSGQGDERKLRLKSFYGDDEKQLLTEFIELLNAHYNSSQHFLCGHNGKEFDFPYLCRRMLINGLVLPVLLDTAGKKPWEVTHIDTMELWKFGDYKHYTSLDLLTAIFGIPTPKDDIDGSQIREVYYEEKDLERIVEYCQKDVAATVQLFLKYKGLDLIPENNIIVV